MSVTIHWRPVGTEEKHFDGGTSSSLDVLKQTFGDEISPDDVPVLRGMARAAKDKFYDEVADTVENFGIIKIWGKY